MKTENTSVKSTLTAYRKKYGWGGEKLSVSMMISAAAAVIYALWKTVETMTTIKESFGESKADHTIGTNIWSVVTAEKNGMKYWRATGIYGGEINLLSLLLVIPAVIALVLAVRHVGEAASEKYNEENTTVFMKKLSGSLTAVKTAGFLSLGIVITGASALNCLLRSYAEVGYGISGPKPHDPSIGELAIIGYCVLTALLCILSAFFSAGVCTKMKKVLKGENIGSDMLRKAENRANRLGKILAVLMAAGAAVILVFAIIGNEVGGTGVYLSAAAPLAAAYMLHLLNKHRASQSSSFMNFLKKSE